MVSINVFQMDLGRADPQLLLPDNILYAVQATAVGATVFNPWYT